MPYITLKAKQELNAGRKINTAGELNYAFTTGILEYVETKGLSYQTINDIIGALEGAKSEFYRRVVSDYEDQKRIDNGEVY